MSVGERERMVQTKVTKLQNFFAVKAWELTELGKAGTDLKENK